jgi:hypothetical protein
MSRVSESITRADVRFPNKIYDTVQQIAIKDGARIHHISRKVEVSSTIVKLVQLGIDALNGKLPDSNSLVPDKQPDNLSDNATSILSDTKSTVSGITSEVSDRLMQLVDDRVASHHVLSRGDVLGLIDIQLLHYGLVGGRQVRASINLQPLSLPESDSDTLPDTENTLPDNLPDKDVIISDRGASLPDSLPDTENIPSDASSNSESIAEDVRIIQAEAIEQVIEDNPRSFSFAEFHIWLNLPKPDKRNKASGDSIIAIAKEQGRGDWEMDSKSYRFTKITGD